MNTVWAYAKCKSTELLVLLALADFSDDNGENIYPSIATLAQKARLSDDQARRVVKTLVKLELIEIVEAGGWRHGRNRSNSYRILLENIEPGTRNLQVPPLRPRGDSTRAGASTVLAPMQDDPSSDPLYKPPDKPKRRPPAQKKNYHPDEYADIIL